jgi:protein-disulfide isomerase
MSRILQSVRRILSVVICVAGILLPAVASYAESDWSKMLRSAPPIGERSLGMAGAPVVVLEYASATCPHCGIFHVQSWPQIKREYVDTGKVRWIIREIPLDSLSMAAFMLARCMPADRYFATLDSLFAEQKLWMGTEPRNELWKLMQRKGMQREQFDYCLARQDLSEAIYHTAKQAVEEFGVKSTPTFFVNGRVVHGAQTFAFFQELIEAELRKAERQ